jgi:hypothetical protein
MTPRIYNRQTLAETGAPEFLSRFLARFDIPTKRDMQQFPLVAGILVFTIAILLMASAGCRQKVTLPPVAPPPSQVKQTVDVSPKAITPEKPAVRAPEPVSPIVNPKAAVAAPSSFDLGEASLKAKNYAKAARSFEDYLEKRPASSDRDIALFRLGLSLALTGNTGRNMRRAEETLKHLIEEYPESPYCGSAEAILGLQSRMEGLQADLKEKDAKIKQLSEEMQKLNEELQKLKEIDLRRRPASTSH